MRIFRLAGLAIGLVMFLMLVGCGETYRPVVNPFPSPGGDPQKLNTIIVVNQGVKADPGRFGQILPQCQSTDTCPGSVSQLDVPSDANMMNRTIGQDPVGIFSVGFLNVANRGDNSVSSFFTSGSTVTSLPLRNSFDALVDATNTTKINVTGPSFIGPSFGTQFLVTMPACATAQQPAPPPAAVCTAPDTNNPGVLAAVNFSSGAFQVFQVGNYPIAAVESPNRSRIYVLNFSSSSIDVFAGLDYKRLGTVTGNGISSPVFAVARPESDYVFVLNRGNGAVTESSLTVFNTSNDSIPFSPSLGTGGSSTPPDVPLNNPMFYDNTAKKWLWVTNPNDDSVTVFDASKLSQSTPELPVQRRIPRCADSNSTNCFPQGTAPISVTALGDGTRAYVLGAGDPTATPSVPPSVYVINTTDFAVRAVEPFDPQTKLGYNGTSPRGIISSPDSTKVYVINHDSTTEANPSVAGAVVTTQRPGTNIIRTSDNTFLKDATGRPMVIPAPFQDALNCQLDTPEPWASNHLYAPNSTVMPNPSNGHAYQAMNAGTSGANSPAFCTTTGCTLTEVLPADSKATPVIWREIEIKPGEDFNTKFNCPRQRPTLIALPD